MPKFVRASHYRHVFGTAPKRELCYDNIKITKSSWDSSFCAVNPKFIAVVLDSSGGGAFLVLPLDKVRVCAWCRARILLCPHLFCVNSLWFLAFEVVRSRTSNPLEREFNGQYAEVSLGRRLSAAMKKIPKTEKCSEVCQSRKWRSFASSFDFYSSIFWTRKSTLCALFAWEALFKVLAGNIVQQSGKDTADHEEDEVISHRWFRHVLGHVFVCFIFTSVPSLCWLSLIWIFDLCFQTVNKIRKRTSCGWVEA